eukprot:1155590-Pelagomonas_calceolata.AAC.1
MEPRASKNPSDPHYNFHFIAPWWRRFKALLSQCVPFSLIDVGRVSSAYVVFFLFFPFMADKRCEVQQEGFLALSEGDIRMGDFLEETTIAMDERIMKA